MDEFDGYIAELYREMELELISSMKRNLALHLAEEQKTGIKYPQWQAIKLKELKRFQRENADIIGRRTKGLSKDVSEHMQSELKEGSAHEFKVYREALGQGYKSAKAVKDSFFRVDAEKVKGVINALDNDLTTANAAMFRMVNDTYRQVIYKYGFFMANGTYTYKQAYDAATKDFLERGINCIEYKDGRRVNIADYCRMAVRTSSQRAYMVGQGEVRKRIGNPLIIITKHNTSCKLCKPFERKVLIDDVYSGGTQEDGDYMLLSQAMELGLYHPNCRHGSDTYYREREEFFKGYYKSHPELDNPLSETAADDYGEHNEAHIDNMIQRYRRLVTGSVDKENIANYQLLLDKWLDKRSAVVDKSVKNDIISLKGERGIEKQMNVVDEKRTVAGSRRTPFYELTAEDIEFVKTEIEAINADKNDFVFNSSVTKGTCFLASDGKVHIKGNIFPDEYSSHPRDKLSVRAVLAHEYYGHRPYRKQYLKEDSDTSPEALNRIIAKAWADEFRASYMAAKNAPNLSDLDRTLLIQDSLSRAEEAGVTIKYNDFIRRVLYG